MNRHSQTFSLSHRRGARAVARHNRGNSNHILRVIVGFVALYVISTLILHPAANSKENQMSKQRGARVHKPGEKHSPLMLLRERDVARRDQEDKEHQVMIEPNKAKAGEVSDAADAIPVVLNETDASHVKQHVTEGMGGRQVDEHSVGAGQVQRPETSEAQNEDSREQKPPQPSHHMTADEIIAQQQKKVQAKFDERKKRLQEAAEASQREQERIERAKRQGQEQLQIQLQRHQSEKQEREDEERHRKRRKGGDHLATGNGRHAEPTGQSVVTGNATALEDGKKENQTAKEEAKKKAKKRLLPKMNHDHDSDAPVEGDPLRANQWPFEFQKIDMKPSVEYLGTLIDGGRHYFPIEWLKRVVDRISDMNYNLIHLRLTDDQTFNLLLKSRPQLAYPQAFDNPGRKVWTAEEMRDLTAYAKAKNVFIMPEVNVPGHAGSWFGIPDMVVHCPHFVCERGYGLPLNVSHSEIKPILTDIIKEIVEIFDDPPFLHLGGDEVNMADPCFHEVGKQRFDYPAFEVVLKDIIKDSGYPEDRVVRWEMTGQDNLDRAGAIEQFWESHPGDRHQAKGRYFVSTWLYLDTNTQQDAYDVYDRAYHNFRRGGQVPTAIIVGTFELSVQFWYDRNVLGRLLSVAIGANNPKLPSGENERRQAVLNLWRSHCDKLGLGEIICETDGRPVIETRFYHERWRAGWDIWKRDICERLTERIDYRAFTSRRRERHEAVEQSNKYFWKHFPLETAQMDLDSFPSTQLPEDLKGLLKHTITHTGVIIDAVSTMPKLSRLHTIIRNYLARMGFNLVQLGLVGNAGFGFNPTDIPDLGHSLLADAENPLYEAAELGSLVEVAATAGVAIMPEITVSTDAAGWFNAGFTIQCPIRFCGGKTLSNNVNDHQLLPLLYSVIGELRTIFSSTKLFHLGTDARSESMDCWTEAGETPDFDKFESKLETLLALANLAPEETVRKENKEGFRYPHRAGGVTQYPVGQLDDIRTDELFFLTIDLFDGDAYKIFENAKKAAARQPLGILADLPKLSESKFDNWEIPKRLLAFAMGVSEIASFWSLYDEVSFNSYFTQLCEALELADDCSLPSEARFEVELVSESSEFLEKQCNALVTDFENVLVAKKPVLPWFEREVTIQ